MRNWLLAIILSGAAVPTAGLAQNAPADEPARHAFSVKYQDLKWEKTNPEQGTNSPEVAILHQDTKETELFIRSPKNYHVPRHWHSSDETITVLRGTFILKHDGSEDRTTLNVGDFGYMPAKMVHEAWTGPGEEAVYFITTDGAFDINWVKEPPQATH
jgi:quercetin dioxygenase-like cupin family protein